MSSAGICPFQPAGSSSTIVATVRSGTPSAWSMRSVWSRESVGSRSERRAVCVEAREEERALHLGARDGQVVLDRAEVLVVVEARDAERRGDVAGLRRVRRALDVRAARPQRSRDAHHRAARERRVADERARERLRAEDAAQEAHRRAGVAAVEIGSRRAQTEEPGARDDDVVLVVFVALVGDLDAHRRERAARRVVVLAAGPVADAALAVAERTEEERAMRDALVRRHRYASDERLFGRVHDERGHLKGGESTATSTRRAAGS